MTMKELTQKLEERYPLEKAESWDNSGLQVGRKNKAVRIFGTGCDRCSNKRSSRMEG